MSMILGPSLYDEPESIKVTRSPEGACTVRFEGYLSERNPVRILRIGDASVVIDQSELRRIRAITVPYSSPPISQLEKALAVVVALPGRLNRDATEDRDNQAYCAEAIRQAMQLPEARIWPYFYFEPDFTSLSESLMKVID